MFDWFKRQLEQAQIADREVRIEAAFPNYEKARRAEHIAQAFRRFSTSELEQEVSRRMKPTKEEAQRRFEMPIADMERELASLSAQMTTSRTQLAIFDRPYKAELDPLYSELKVLADQKSLVYVEKSAAHARLERAKDNINSWHSKSKRTPWLFGNGGKELPEHSIFGQSFGDLDGYKTDRGIAVQKIDRCGREIDRIKNRINEIGVKIDSIKKERQRMFDLRDQGIHPSKIKRTIAELERHKDNLRGKLSELRIARSSFLDAAKYATGVVTIEKEILAIKLRQDDFIRSFDDPKEQEARRAAHREDWFNAYGRGA